MKRRRHVRGARVERAYLVAAGLEATLHFKRALKLARKQAPARNINLFLKALYHTSISGSLFYAFVDTSGFEEQAQ